MKRLQYLLMLALCGFLSFSLVSCDDDDDDDDTTTTPATEVMLDQTTFSKAINEFQLNITGPAEGAGAHDAGSGIDADKSIRDVWGSFNKSDEAKAGDIIIKHTFNSEDGTVDTKDDASTIVFAMIKQADGIADSTGNWTWYNIKYDNEGSLDLAGATKVETVTTGCFSCHGGQEDSRFIR
jgi:hypothetical protein